MGLFKRLRCKHNEARRCIHGDEINFYKSRVICCDCGKALRNVPMPKVCWYTGKLHWGVAE